MNKKLLSQAIFSICMAGSSAQFAMASGLTYAVVDSLQTECFDLQTNMQTCPTTSASLHGQDAQYQGLQPSYQKNQDGTVTDNNTGLIWNPSLDTNADGSIDINDKISYDDAFAFATASRFGGFDDWRVPTIKELYSLTHFDGQDPSGLSAAGTHQLTPFIDQNYFDFSSGDIKNGERLIDGQYLSATKYVSTTMPGKDETLFGVNFIDGRIKGYGMANPRNRSEQNRYFLLLVRGNQEYGINKFVDTKKGAINDSATGLTWQQQDSQTGMDWPEALAYCENLTLAGSDEWRLPNVKELESIVDYTRSPATSNSAAIDPIFSSTQITNENKQIDYPAYWSSSTHISHREGNEGRSASYITFGRAIGNMRGQWIDVHGAGAQRSDPKQGDASRYPNGFGPQGDAIRIDNYVRCVTGGAEKAESPSYVQRDKVTIVLTGDEAGVDEGKGKGKPPQKPSH